MNLSLSIERRGGGGSTTVNEYENIQKAKKRLCLCIVDSDKLAPNDNLGKTAKKVQNKDDPNCLTTELVILDIREIENLIPNSILSEVCSGDRARSEALSIIEKSYISNIRKFLDIKKGTFFETILNESSDQVQNFWQDALSKNPDISTHIDRQCQENWKCKNPNNKESCKKSCYISLGFGEGILENTLEWLGLDENQSPQRIAEIAKMIDPSLQQDWDKIGQIMIDWCCALGSIRTL